MAEPVPSDFKVKLFVFVTVELPVTFKIDVGVMVNIPALFNFAAPAKFNVAPLSILEKDPEITVTEPGPVIVGLLPESTVKALFKVSVMPVLTVSAGEATTEPNVKPPMVVFAAITGALV